MRKLLSSSAYIILNKNISKIVGINAALLLGDLISKEDYFISRDMLVDGYFFNTSKDITESTTLTRNQQVAAINKLKDVGILDVIKFGVPPKNHYRINEDKISHMLNISIQKSKNQQLNVLKSAYINKNKLITNNISINERLENFKNEVISHNILDLSESKKFISYWIESNKSGKKMRFEMEKTFNIKMRLDRWSDNSKKWNTKKETKRDAALNSASNAFEIINKKYGN